jgi:hypothetical protein
MTMRRSFAIATVVVVGMSGAASVYAGSNISFSGGSTLSSLTLELLTGTSQNSNSPLCPGAVGLTYTAGGSSVGEQALVAGTQQIAPMTRFLQGSTTGLCSADSTDGNNAQGLVFALDGLAIVSSTQNGGATACNGTAGSTNSSCTATTTNVGLAYNTTVTETGFGGGTYTFSSWKDVLKVLYAGIAHSGAASTDQGCGGNIREYLAANYGQVFEVANCTSGCTQIQHLFRRDDSTGTADIFSQLLGLTSPNNTTNQLGQFYLGTDSFCNAFHATTSSSANAAGASVQSQLPVLSGATTSSVTGATASWQNVVPYDYQDNDPIRRTCAGTCAAGRTGTAHECVCEPTGNLGLLLPMPDTNQAGANQFGSGLACTGPYVLVAAPTVPAYNSSGRLANVSATCPNGDDPSAGNCFVPSDANGNPNCVAAAGNNSGPIVNTTPANGLNPSTADGRAFNKWTYNFVSGGGIPTVATDNTNNGSATGGQRPIFGAFYRLHQLFTMNNPDNVNPCTQSDMTLQIGCLAQASPCSLGYAGRNSDQWNGTTSSGTTAMLVNAIPDAQLCVQEFAYPLSRKLYLDTLVGFASVTGQELALAQCENNGGTITAPGISKLISDNNFIPLPATLTAASGGTTATTTTTNGAPFAEDFNEQMLCATSSNSYAPSSNGSVGLPTIGTTCGNGIKESFEDCDLGAASNGPLPATCSTTCRTN